jgi:hypothetical protein
MKSYTIGALIVAILFIIFSCVRDRKVNTKNNKENEDYVLTSSINESCLGLNVLFTDSIWYSWNKNSCIFLEKEFKITNDSCLYWPYKQFLKGENYRLEFGKVVNRKKILSEKDLKSVYFIIEVERLGAIRRMDNFLITKDENNLKTVEFRFSNVDTTWLLQKEYVIDEKRFDDFYGSLKRCKRNEDNFNIGGFNISKFSKDTIECYLSYCKYCNECIDQFNRLVHYY